MRYLICISKVTFPLADLSDLEKVGGTTTDNQDDYQFVDYIVPVTANVTAACICETPKEYEVCNDGMSVKCKTTTEDEVRSQEWEDNCRWELNSDEPVYEESELVGDGDD